MLTFYYLQFLFCFIYKGDIKKKKKTKRKKKEEWSTLKGVFDTGWLGKGTLQRGIDGGKQ